VTIETANTHVAPGQPDTADGLAPGEYVQLTVSDDGCGMDAETRAGVFEPFFTTKGIGDGTGLGLATVYGIVHQNEGSISVSSEPGEGSTFTILLPRHTGQTTVTDEDQAGQHVGGTETVLLVEDEDAILRLASALLQRLGYRVITAVSPSDALREAQTHCGEIDLLFTDVVMPGMNGHDLYRQLREICPDLQCLFASGFAADAMAEHGMLADDVHFIQKPYSISALAEGLRNALRS
jgi:CheY-like chemotaxis protein